MNKLNMKKAGSPIAKKKYELGDESFYVGLKDPIELRRGILESSRMMIKALQGYEKIEKIKLRRADKIAAFKRSMNDIDKLCQKLKKDLPKTRMFKQFEKKEEIESEKSYSHNIASLKAKTPRTMPQTLNKLESDLDYIEKKLRSLN